MIIEPGVLLLLGIVLATIIFVAGYIFGFNSRENKINLRNLKYYEKKYLRKIGYTVGYGSYNLRSLDGGQNWYAVKCTSNLPDSEKIEIIGPAEEVFPGLLEKLKSIDELVRYAQKGPITEMGPEEKIMFEKAGFTMKEIGPPDEKTRGVN